MTKPKRQPVRLAVVRAAEPALRLSLLGALRFEGAGTSLPSLARRKSQAVLARLAVPLGQPVSRATLTALLWSNVGAEQANDGLRHVLTDIRKALGRDAARVLLTQGDMVALAGEAVEADVAAFERLAQGVTPAALEDAVSRYTGDFLSGFDVKEEAFEEWVRSERQRLRRLAIGALQALLTRYTAAGDLARAMEAATRLLALEPLDESVHRALMRLHASQGQRPQALRQYQACVAILEQELGAEPEAATKELYRELARSSPSVITPPRRSTPLIVGRESELAALGATTRAVGDGPAVWAIVGEAGIGKTTLVESFAAGAAASGALVLVGHCFEAEQVLPLGPWVTALRGSGIVDDPGVQAALDSTSRSELARLFPELGKAAAVADDAGRLFEAFRRLLGHLAASGRLVIVVEDAHWADDTSLRLLGFLARRLPASVQFVMTLRPEALVDSPALSALLSSAERERRLHRLDLGPLTQGATLDLVRALGRPRPGRATDELGAQVWEASAGHALLAAEMARTLASEDAPGGRLPRGVEALFTERLERLTPRAAQAVGVAAVVGRSFPFALLAAAADLDDAAGGAVVEELVRRFVLHDVNGELDFRHARIRDVASTRLTAAHRRLYHRRVAEAIQQLYPNDLDRHAFALAAHFREADAWDAVATYAHRAGNAAFIRGAHQEAIAAFEQALDALGRLPREPATARREIDARLDLYNALSRARRFDDARAALDRALGLARETGDAVRVRQALLQLAAHTLHVTDYAAARDFSEEAQAITEPAADVAVRMRLAYSLGAAAVAMGRLPEAVHALEGIGATLTGPLRRERFGGTDATFVIAAWSLSLARGELGQFDEGLAHLDEAARVAEELDDAHSRIVAGVARGRLLLLRGDHAAALPVLERTLALIEGSGVILYRPSTKNCLGWALAADGRKAEARRHLDEVVARIDSTGLPGWHSITGTELIQGLAEAGDIDTAQRGARVGLAQSEKHGAYAPAVTLLQVLGDLAAARGADADAESLFDEALQRAQALGLRRARARVQLSLGQVERRRGREAEGRERIAAAAAEFRVMGMTAWLARAEALAT